MTSEGTHKPNCKGERLRDMRWGHIPHFRQWNKMKSNSLRRMSTSKFFLKSLFSRGTGSSLRLDWQSLAWNQDRCCWEGSLHEAVRYFGLLAPWPLTWTPLLCFELLLLMSPVQLRAHASLPVCRHLQRGLGASPVNLICSLNRRQIDNAII